MTIKETISITPTKQSSTVITTGLALFAMFFGAGNLIFPILIGKSVGSNVWFAILGLSITAVIVPFLGLAAMMFFKGNAQQFFGRLGKYPGFLLFLILQLILGPFGVIPRLITLMHATSKSYLGDISLPLFSLLTALLIFACSFKKQYLIQLIGTILTPIKLISLGALVVLGLWGSHSLNPTQVSAKSSFLEGFLGGYNTMDLIAAFIFATLILPHFEKESQSELPADRQRAIFKKMLLSSLIAASLLLITYIGLAWVASYHAWKFDPSFPPQEMLGAIAFQILGPIGGCIAMVAVTFACLTTAITLSATFSEYLQKDVSKNKMHPMAALLITLCIAAVIANLQFSGILAILKPILQIIYPGLILLSGLNILHALYGIRMVKTPVFAIFAIGMIYFKT
jgi:branched-chain amino acid:cation transporter, LIVCS family